MVLLALYIVMQKKNIENFLNERNIKIMKQAHAFKGYASSYNVEIFNSFDPELQIKDNAQLKINQKIIE